MSRSHRFVLFPRCCIGVIAAAALVASTAAASVALAATHPIPGTRPIPGAKYSGTSVFDRRYPGPNLSFRVSGDGHSILAFKNAHSPNAPDGFGEPGYCGGIWFGQPHNVAAPLINVNSNGTFFGKKVDGSFTKETTIVRGHFTQGGHGAVGRIVYRQPAGSHTSHCNFNATFTVHTG